MKYEKEAEALHHYNFVFYEVKKRTVYIFCPEDGSTEKYKLNKNETVASFKDRYRPACYENIDFKIEWKRTCYEYKNLQYEFFISEMTEADNGIDINIYLHTADFWSEEYKAFYRFPQYYDELVGVIHYGFDKQISIKTKLYPYVSCFAYHQSIGYEMREKKYLSSVFYNECFITESLNELKMTPFEKFIPIIDGFADLLLEISNIGEPVYDESIYSLLYLLLKYPIAESVWKAGYKRLIFNKVMEIGAGKGCIDQAYGEDIKASGKILNWNAKTIDKFLRVKPSVIDNVFKRDDLTVENVKNVQKLCKMQILVTVENLEIIHSFHIDELLDLIKDFSYNKVFKYIRNQSKKNNYVISNIVSDFCDYLFDLRTLKIPFTEDVVFPTLLPKTHKNFAERVREQKNKDRTREFEKMTDKFSDLNYSDKKYSISVIRSIKHLNYEAATLHNCSAGYVDRICSGECLIFVIHQLVNKGIAFCMLELNLSEMQIVQNRTYHNAIAPDEVMEFADIWLRNIVKSGIKKILKAVA